MGNQRKTDMEMKLYRALGFPTKEPIPAQDLLRDFKYFAFAMARFICSLRRKLRRKHFILLAASLVLLAVVQYGTRGGTKNEQQPQQQKQQQQQQQQQVISSSDTNKEKEVVASSNEVNKDLLNKIKQELAPANISIKDIPGNVIGPNRALQGKPSIQDAWKNTNLSAPVNKQPSAGVYSNNEAKPTKPSIPNIVHLLWIGKDKPMTFANYLSVKSVYKNHNPIAIILHYDDLPIGYWFEQIKHDIPKFKTRFYKMPKEVGGIEFHSIFDQVNIMSLQILLQHGGIYMENDVIVLRKLEPMRRFNVSIGQSKTQSKLSPAFIMAARNTSFIRKWYNSYLTDYRPTPADYNRAVIPFKLAQKYPALVHVDKFRLTTPDSSAHVRLVKNTVAWDNLFIVHLMTRMFSYKTFTPESIKNQNSTLGEIARLVYYGSTHIIANDIH